MSPALISPREHLGPAGSAPASRSTEGSRLRHRKRGASPPFAHNQLRVSPRLIHPGAYAELRSRRLKGRRVRTIGICEQRAPPLGAPFTNQHQCRERIAADSELLLRTSDRRKRQPEAGFPSGDKPAVICAREALMMFVGSRAPTRAHATPLLPRGCITHGGGECDDTHRAAKPVRIATYVRRAGVSHGSTVRSIELGTTCSPHRQVPPDRALLIVHSGREGRKRRVSPRRGMRARKHPI
jgi:hypothetical protein